MMWSGTGVIFDGHAISRFASHTSTGSNGFIGQQSRANWYFLVPFWPSYLGMPPYTFEGQRIFQLSNGLRGAATSVEHRLISRTAWINCRNILVRCTMNFSDPVGIWLSKSWPVVYQSTLSCIQAFLFEPTVNIKGSTSVR